jgi:hypothetical protein
MLARVFLYLGALGGCLFLLALLSLARVTSIGFVLSWVLP